MYKVKVILGLHGMYFNCIGGSNSTPGRTLDDVFQNSELSDLGLQVLDSLISNGTVELAMPEITEDQKRIIILENKLKESNKGRDAAQGEVMRLSRKLSYSQYMTRAYQRAAGVDI